MVEVERVNQNEEIGDQRNLQGQAPEHERHSLAGLEALSVTLLVEVVGYFEFVGWGTVPWKA